MEKITNNIISILVEIDALNISPEKIENDVEITLYGVNSINFIQLIVNLENLYNIEFDENNLDFSKLSTINKLVEYISIKLNS